MIQMLLLQVQDLLPKKEGLGILGVQDQGKGGIGSYRGPHYQY
jgi:hypothetical protein